MKNFFKYYVLAVIVYSIILAGCAASKVTVTPYVGNWYYTAQTQDGEMDVVMTINETENGYSGYLSSDMGSVDLSDLVIEDGKLTASFEIGGYEIPIKGTFDGDIFDGTSTWEGNDMPMKATRKQETDK